MPVVPESPRPKRSILKLSLGISLWAVATIVAAILFVGAPTADAQSACTWSGGAGPLNWTAVGAWNCSPAQTYPGQNAGITDTATFLSSPIVQVTTSLPGLVALSVTGGSPQINVNTGGTLPLPSASLASGGTIIANTGGAVVMTGPSTFAFGGGLNINGGIVTNSSTIGMGNLSVFTFHGGTLTGAGTTTLSTGSSVTFDNTAGSMTIAGGQVVDNLSTAAFTGSLLLNNGQIKNEAAHQFNLTNATIAGPGTTLIDNFGSMLGNGTSTIGVPFNNESGASITVPSLTDAVAFNGGGAHAGTFTFGTNTSQFTFGGGTHTFNAGANFSGTGIVNLTSGMLSVNTGGSLALTNFNMSGGTLLTPFPNGATVSGTMNWTGGTISGNGVTRINGIVNIGPTAPTTLDLGAQLEVAGTANYGASLTNFLTLMNGSRIIVDNSPLGQFNINTASFIGSDGTVGTSFDNFGMVTKSGAGTAQITANFMQSNFVSSALNVTGGVLNLAGGGSSNGSFSVSPGATLAFSAGGFGLSALSSLNGGGIYNLTGTGFLNVFIPLNCPTNFIQDGSSVLNINSSPFTIAAGSTYKWNGGTIFGGNLVVGGGSLLIDTTTGGANLDGGCVLNYTSGTMLWSAGANPLTLKQNAVMNLAALFDIRTAANLDAQGVISGAGLRIRPTLIAGGTININSGGTLQKSVSAGQVLIGADVTNNAGGTINVMPGAGLLALSGPDPVTHSGNFNVQSAGTLDFSAGTHTITAGSTFSGGGTLKIHGATVDLTPNVSVFIFDMAGGTLTGSGNVNTTGSFVWDGGTMSGTGTTTVAGGTSTISGALGVMTLARPLVVAAGVGVSYSGPNSLTITTGGSLTNNGTFGSVAPSPIQWTGSPAGGILNSSTGTFLMMNPVTNDFYPPFTNAGTVLLPVSGTTIFRNGYTQTAGLITIGPGNVSVPGPATMAINGGILNGTGNIQAAVTVGQVSGPAASLNPGTSPGTIAINGSYTQNATGTLNIDLNGTTPGTLYDQLNVTGPVTLAGILNVILGYTPANGDTYNVLTFTSVSGDFTTKNLPTFPPNGTIQASYTATALQLLAVAPSADLGVTKVLAGTLVAGSPAVYTVTIKNFGPNDATNVAVTDPTPAGLTFTSNSGACSIAYPCTIALLTAGSTATITSTYSVPSNASGSVTNTVSVAASAPPDFNSLNDSATVGPSAISQKADVSVTKAGPAVAQPNTNVTYNITVTNNGPSDASSVILDDPTPSRLTFVSATGACTSFPCTIGTMTPGQLKTVQAKYMVLAGPTATITNTASASSSTPDPNTANNSASASSATGCPTATPANVSPADGATNVLTTGVLSWSDVSAGSYVVHLDVAGPNACTKFFASTTATSIPYAGLQEGTTYQWRVDAVTAGCQTLSTACMSFTTSSTCPLTPPTLLSPVNTTVIGPATFTWSAVAGAVDYKLFLNGGLLATTTATTFGPVPVGSGSISWYVVAEFAPPCGSLQSQGGSFNGCDNSVAPLASVVGQAASGQGYDISWNILAGTTRNEVDESQDPSFSAVTTRTINAPPAHFVHNVNTATAFYYRVRSFLPCANGFTPNSPTVRVVLTPLSDVSQNPNVSVPVGNTDLVQIIVHVPGFPDGTFPFTASLDKPWLIKVEPSSGLLPPEGIDLTVFADPRTLPNGTFTGTVILSVNFPSSGGIAVNGVKPVSAPVSISLVTPITPKPSGTPPPEALIIPSVGHLDGFNSHWQSDIRVANTSTTKAQYQLTFTPDDIGKGVKQTIIDVDPGVTTALDDIIKTWYGVGSLGETANGVLEIRPAGSSGKTADGVSVSLTTVASSRTYNVASNGTLGQFIPAVAFSNFIGKAADANHAAAILGLQQIAQSNAYRTNVGVVEASGHPAAVVITAFDDAGKKLFDFPLNLNANQQVQLNSFLAQNGITNLEDGRLEVRVANGDGKITTYASVVDNRSGDPLLVSGVPLGQLISDHYVLPGVADLNTGLAAWRTDMRIFNPTTTAQFATLTFYPQNNGGAPQTSSMTVNPGETKQLDNALSTLFGASNTGGAMHLTLGNPASLVVTGRTYNLTSNGTFGQFIPAVTANDAVGKGDRALQILQAEDSVRYRTNLGIAEVTGKSATVEVSVVLPDSKVSPSTQIPLAANGFLQVPVIQSLGLTNVYNARISVRVIDGDGKIAAYGSVIDQKTQDPTYVPAQ